MSQKRYSKHPDIDRAVRTLVKTGEWIVKQGRHLRLENKVTHIAITVPGTPSDPRAAMNWFSQLRRAGVDLNRERTA